MLMHLPAPAPAPAPSSGDERQPPTRIPVRDWNRNNNNALRNFKGKEASLPVLGTRKEAWTQNTTHFLKELENYVLRNFKQPAPIARGIVELEDPNNFLSDELQTLTRCMEKLVTLAEATATETDVEKVKREADNADKLAAVKLYQSSQMAIFSKKMDVTTSNMTTLWGIIIGQCTKALVADIRAEHDYEDKAEAFDSIWLLKTIKRIVHRVTASSNDFHTAFCSIKNLYKFRQGNQRILQWDHQPSGTSKPGGC
ncbi:predicted protein [Chaetoceros tenuissimus]|uniref:Uncharacterized protein n=1 Tax=Chaetoceros tenuissimus TaxID=426638 RepID=A0AAD3D2R7_9STRA|nr:predicted protein [Chaetoceros tenuissimus]